MLDNMCSSNQTDKTGNMQIAVDSTSSTVDYLEQLKSRRDLGLTDDPLNFDLHSVLISLAAKMKEEADYFFQKMTFLSSFAPARRALPLLIRKSEQEEALWREITLDTRFYAAFQNLILPEWAIEKGYFFHRSHIQSGEDRSLSVLRDDGGMDDDGGIAYGVILRNNRKTGFSTSCRNLLPASMVASAAVGMTAICFALNTLSLLIFTLSLPIGIVIAKVVGDHFDERNAEDYEHLKLLALARFRRRWEKEESCPVFLFHEACCTELARMLTLFSSQPGLATRSKIIDMLWHEFISDTRLYRMLCLDKLGLQRVVQHIPGTQANDP